MSKNCIFCKIINKTFLSDLFYEDTDCIGIYDVKPIAKIHGLLIPKKHIQSLDCCEEDDLFLLGKLLILAPKLAVKIGCSPGPTGGFKLVINVGKMGGQEIQHLHFHILHDLYQI